MKYVLVAILLNSTAFGRTYSINHIEKFNNRQACETIKETILEEYPVFNTVGILKCVRINDLSCNERIGYVFKDGECVKGTSNE